MFVCEKVRFYKIEFHVCPTMDLDPAHWEDHFKHIKPYHYRGRCWDWTLGQKMQGWPYGLPFAAMWPKNLDRCCWMRCTHFSNYEAWGASGNYEAQGASDDYKAWGASGDYKAWGASGRKYEARMVIFRILAAINRFSWISRKEESHWRKQKAVEENWEAAEESGKPLKKNRKPIGESWISCEENLDIGEGFHNISKRFSSIGDSFPTCNW